MKIGIDAKWYFEGPASGKMVIRNLVNSLLQKEDEALELYFFLDKKYKNHSLDFDSVQPIHKIFIWSGNNLLSNVFIIPYYAEKYNLDIVLYQASVSCFGKHKKIAYIHDIIFISHPQYYTFIERLYFSPIKFLTRFASLIVTVSNFEKERITQLNFSSKDIKVIHHGVDPIFKPKKAYDLNRVKAVKQKYNLPDKFILYVGRLNTRKNVPNLLKAYALLKNTDYLLVLVGNKEWKTDNIILIQNQLNIKDRVIETGSVQGEDLAIIYSLATVFCFPSFEESFGLPPLEAMASGVPIIVSNSSAIPEVCGVAGNYVEATNPTDIAQGIERLLTHPNIIAEKIQQGIERSKELSWDNATDKLLTIFHDFSK